MLHAFGSPDGTTGVSKPDDSNDLGEKQHLPKYGDTSGSEPPRQCKNFTLNRNEIPQPNNSNAENQTPSRGTSEGPANEPAGGKIPTSKPQRIWV